MSILLLLHLLGLGVWIGVVGAELSALFLTKLAFALLAIFFNGVCVHAVFKRRASLRSGDTEGLATAGRAMKLGGAIVPTFLVAFALGLSLAVR